MLKEKKWKKEFEKPIYEEWVKTKVFGFDEKSKKPVFSIDTPPPYVNRPIHIGQATTYVLMDMFARFKRMCGFNVLFPLGLDRNGLPIETETEKTFKVKMNEVSREEFIKLCKKILEQSSAASIDYFLKLGISFNSFDAGEKIGDLYLTDSDEYRALTQATFIDLWNKGLIYEDERINTYCPGCRTTIADAEIEYKDLPTLFVDVKFKVKETGEEIIIGTTRPELICTCGMVIFNPKDERYKHLEGKTAVTPLFNKEVPIRPHPYADMEKGTGLVMMCSAGDQTDIRFFREMGLEPTIAINEDGKMNEHAGFLNGLPVSEARKKMIEELEKAGLIVGKKKIMHRTPICERSKDPIEFISQKEYYLKQLEFRDEMKKIAKKINFFSPRSRRILLDWIDSLAIDWPISRRRYYATEIPLWYCKKCGSVLVPEKGKYYKPWKEAPPKKCKCGSTEFKGEERVFDTWFDSSISPLYILKWPSSFFDKVKQCTLRPQGKEIVRTWLYYTLLKCYLLTGKCIFKDVWINYHILDEKGNKMSKSLGNIIEPAEILERFGAEPFRLWCAVEGNITKTDFRCSFERIEGAEKTIIKLWNIARFVSLFPQASEKKLCEADKWIISEVDKLIKYAKEHYEKYDFHTPVTKIKTFIWELFASHYIELVKTRAYNKENMFSKEEQNSALYTLHYCLDEILKMLAPVIPFVTSKLYKDLRGKNIYKEKFPESSGKEYKAFSSDDIINLNSYIWKAKKDRGLSLKAEIKEAVLPEWAKYIEKDLKFMHNIKQIKYGKEIKLKF